MFPAATTAGGQAAAFPDVCKTPTPGGPVPIPYPNMGMVNQAKKTSTKVKFANKPVVTVKSEIPRSMGDEAGTAGGVISGSNMNKVTFKTGATKVKVEGNDVIRLLAVTGHNGSNANMPSGMVVAPSQTKVLVAV